MTREECLELKKDLDKSKDMSVELIETNLTKAIDKMIEKCDMDLSKSENESMLLDLYTEEVIKLLVFETEAIKAASKLAKMARDFAEDKS